MLWSGRDFNDGSLLYQGERLDGRELELDEVGFGAIMTPVDMTRFLEIYTRQTTVNLPVKEDSKKK